MTFEGMSPEDARAFAATWLPAWTGNRPDHLASFYAEDAYYSDPVVRAGVRGRGALLVYFTRLLARNPAWVWTHRGSIPIRDGFLNQWHATIPVGERLVQADGVCTVQLRDGLIYVNEVFFDRTEVVAALRDVRPG